MTVATVAAEGEFRIGQVINRASKVLIANFWFFFVVMVVASLPDVIFSKPSPSPSETGAYNYAITLILQLVVMLVAGVIGQAIVAGSALQYLRGEPVRLGGVFNQALARFFPLFGTTLILMVLVVTLVVGGGLVAVPFVLPHTSPISTVLVMALVLCGFLLNAAAAILLTRWAVSWLACLAEETGPIASLGRSSHLTKGYRWKILGLVLLTIIVSAGGGAIAEFVMGLTGNASANVIGQLLIRGGANAFATCISILIYHDLRAAKEGIASKEIATVFD